MRAKERCPNCLENKTDDCQIYLECGAGRIPDYIIDGRFHVMCSSCGFIAPEIEWVPVGAPQEDLDTTANRRGFAVVRTKQPREDIRIETVDL